MRALCKELRISQGGWEQARFDALNTVKLGSRWVLMRSDRILLIGGGNGDAGCESAARSHIEEQLSVVQGRA